MAALPEMPGPERPGTRATRQNPAPPFFLMCGVSPCGICDFICCFVSHRVYLLCIPLLVLSIALALEIHKPRGCVEETTQQCAGLV